jgi:hypothetical protein
MCAEEHEATSAQIACGGMDDGKSKARGDGSVDSVAALAENLKAGVGGEVMDTDDHSIPGADWLLVQIGNHVLLSLPDWGLSWSEERL